MTPDEFIRKWTDAKLKERSGSHEHFCDLCRLLGQPTPSEADREGTWYTFEKGATKTGGGEGWADVWKRGCFAWEYKSKGRDLNRAFTQLQRYAIALENPPLLVVSDMDTIIIHTNFTYTVQEIHTIPIDEMADPKQRQLLLWMFTDPECLRPGTTRQAVTEKAARAFAGIAQRLRDAGHGPERVAHFVNRLLFCMFAEDIGLLRGNLFIRMLETAARDASRFEPMLSDLFGAMRKGGYFGVDEVAWFNGGLFDDDQALPMDLEGVAQVLAAARMDWSAIEPSIFGTLFERGLDPDKRSQLGAHYTDPGSIMRIVEPVVLAPLQAEWEKVRTMVEVDVEKWHTAKNKQARSAAFNRAVARRDAFLERLRAVRVLDPACGSGNFLYLALTGIKDLEHQVLLEAEADLPRGFPEVGPEAVLGIEVNPYAAELARVTVWIGEIQWTLNHGFGAGRPILKPLENIECRDAVLTPEGARAEWPEAEFIVGNPPFLGDKKMLEYLGDEYVTVLRGAYKGRVPGGADLVTYWFEQARTCIEEGRARRAGLVATNSIRGGKNRTVLEGVTADVPIFAAWSDEPWVVEGAAVRMSLIGFGMGEDTPVLNGMPVSVIHPDLTGGAVDLTQARQLGENAGVAFVGAQKTGPFEISGEQARTWLRLPPNPNGRPNADVVKPWWNGFDVTRRPRDMWIVDFGTDMTEADAAVYEAPFEYVRGHVYPLRTAVKDDGTPRVRREGHRRYWWRFGEARPGMRASLSPLERFIVTPEVAKHRVFVWLRHPVVPDKNLMVIARDDDTSFGILHSRFHELWALRMGTSLEDRPRYTPTTTFQTFPFPEGLTPNFPAASYADDSRAQAIKEAARRLNKLRENWLNPPEWVRRDPEVVPGFPDRLIPIDEHAERELKKRTLTNLYNQRPTWLDHAHRALDAAVAAAYGWAPDLSDDDMLAQLLELNQERSKGAAS